MTIKEVFESIERMNGENKSQTAKRIGIKRQYYTYAVNEKSCSCLKGETLSRWLKALGYQLVIEKEDGSESFVIGEGGPKGKCQVIYRKMGQNAVLRLTVCISFII